MFYFDVKVKPLSFMNSRSGFRALGFGTLLVSITQLRASESDSLPPAASVIMMVGKEKRVLKGGDQNTMKLDSKPKIQHKNTGPRSSNCTNC